MSTEADGFTWNLLWPQIALPTGLELRWWAELGSCVGLAVDVSEGATLLLAEGWKFA
jgi:hypothetical protein